MSVHDATTRVVEATLDVAAELLPDMHALLPKTVRIIGSADLAGEQKVRLRLDVTHSGLAGGPWAGDVRDAGGVRTATFGPVRS